MSDPRYRGGVWQGNAYKHKRRMKLDSPLFYGWELAGKSPTTGYSMYRMGMAFMRCATPQETFLTGHNYLIAIGKRVFTAPGDLARITAEVRQILGNRE